MRRTIRGAIAGLLLFTAHAFARGGVRIGVFGLFHPHLVVVTPRPGGSLLLKGGGASFTLHDGAIARCSLFRRLIQCAAGGQLLRSTAMEAGGGGGGNGDFYLILPGKMVRYFHGSLKISAAAAEIVLVVKMPLEVAVASVVAAESPPRAPLEALKAQAVVTRSYYLAARRRHQLFDFCDTTHCQFLRSPPRPGSPAALATTETEGMVLLYRGNVVPALFTAACGGHTRSLKEIGLTASGYPYYPVPCQPCLEHARAWVARLDQTAAAPLLTGRRREETRLSLDRKSGWETVPGNNYSTEVDGSTIVLRGRGAGHGVGLCQLGAAEMARQGASFESILSHYFPNTRIGSR